MEDEYIIALYFARSEQAIVQTDLKYGSACRKLAYNILRNHADVHECVNDAYLGAWNAIPPAKPNPLLTFVLKIVRNVSLKRRQSNTAIKRSSSFDAAMEEMEQCLACPDSVHAQIETKELAQNIEAFLSTLSKENRVIFLRRYWFCEPYADIAKQVGITEKNVSVRLVRTRRQLRRYLSERGLLP